MDISTLKRGDHVRHPRFDGVALWWLSFERIHFHSAECEWEGCHPDVIDDTQSIVRMVGDDTDHVVETELLERISEDEFCGGCGQIGCGHA